MSVNVEKVENKVLKSKLYEELRIKAELAIDGVNIDKDALSSLDLGGKYQEQVHSGFEMDKETHVGIEYPVSFRLPNGLVAPFKRDRNSDYTIALEGNRYILVKNGNKLFNINFQERPQYYSLKTTDGQLMHNIATFVNDSNLSAFYSNECSYKEKGEDCLFCNVNATKESYAEKYGIFLKTPVQIAETIEAAYKEGIADHVTVTGGIIPERREIEYYLDVAEEIQKKTKLTDFNGTAVIAAPLDLTSIDRLKENGYRTIGLNIEFWDKNYYAAICPGKAKNSGGWDHWLKAIEYAVGVFGPGRVRSNIVGGIEPKQKTIEGVEYFSNLGVICLPSQWCANPGSGLEGHRTPEVSWHLDLAEKAVRLQKKAGITYDQIHDASNNDLGITHDIWKIEDGLL
ncbi:MAG: radical SAM protein [Clostridium sp.]|uniref:radical SAM protein n=1 Tax=Clostridium sp. TaxID=1506 RepID=UPI0039EC8FDD